MDCKKRDASEKSPPCRPLINYAFSYGAHEILRDITFEAGEGQLCALFGPNGSGKTTLFKCCLNFLQPKSGAIYFGGKPIREMNVSAMAKWAAYVPQEHKAAFPFTVREVALMGRSPHMNGFWGSGNADREKVMEVLSMLNIDHLAHKNYNALSGGQRQLTLIARALAQDTPLIFLDEPTSSLDFKNQLLIWNLLREIAGQGRTVLVCTHDPNHVLWFCEQVIVLGEDRRVASQGPPRRALDQNVLRRLFGDVCRVAQADGVDVVLPS
ncbi:MAG: ABC transporter ATP-binding protein [Haliscomenobacter sp.]|nr:ABC transporter ATP-binding protein [Haliscomenobacter sp.]